MKNEKWYQRRLAKYFEEHYSEYEDTAEFYPDPAPNVWKFAIPNFGVDITLICDDTSEIHTNNKFKDERVDTSDYLYKIVKDNTEGLNAIYKDYIINLIGEAGFFALKMNKLIESCGSINDRELYMLVKKES